MITKGFYLSPNLTGLTSDSNFSFALQFGNHNPFLYCVCVCAWMCVSVLYCKIKDELVFSSLHLRMDNRSHK